MAQLLKGKAPAWLGRFPLGGKTTFRVVESAPAESGWLELHRQPVHAIAQPGRLRPVLEHMAQVAAAIGAMHFGARHSRACGRSRCRSHPCSGFQKLGQPVRLSNLVLLE